MTLAQGGQQRGRVKDVAQVPELQQHDLVGASGKGAAVDDFRRMSNHSTRSSRAGANACPLCGVRCNGCQRDVALLMAVVSHSRQCERYSGVRP